MLECILWQLLEDDGVRESRVEDKNKVPAIYVNNKARLDQFEKGTSLVV